MKKCELCGNEFQRRIKIDGKLRNCQRRKYCFDCSPFGSGNTKKLESNKGLSLDEIEQKHKRRNKDKYKKWQRKARKERKEELVNMNGGGCLRCGYDQCIASLTFHQIVIGSRCLIG